MVVPFAIVPPRISPGAVSFAPVKTSPYVNVTDPDSYFLGSAQISITTNYSPGNDVLGFVDTPFITGSFNATSGVLTIPGAIDHRLNWPLTLPNVIGQPSSISTRWSREGNMQ